eukprot:CAMPEP_0198310984 /NCGR_PEP_ID=MMETSP1450-20131203/2862_1 /TAXON_ID=753684 ORGANISM="Madagascaria erythrocladiodes, Strain CCMP3234" /NCGR_SAMPLE_ID=MMETSP1450 /ASSEMBLY_ACC=CAM_ASM_001115 /LENGTH=134 /DNA_ID=CAMNT_0044013839 /DNA_START=63 /DNA_END=464 /DNA_ORIENTATION=+
MKSLITLMFVVTMSFSASGDPYLLDCCTSEETSLDSGFIEDSPETAIQRNVKASMIGTWESTEYPFVVKNDKKKGRKEGAFLMYTFSPDGTYSISYGDASSKVQEKGIWTISSNGKKIQLLAENAKRRQTILIK